MYIYESYEKMVEQVAANIEKQIAKLTEQIDKAKSKRSHEYIEAIARRSAYNDVLDMLTEYSLKEDALRY